MSERGLSKNADPNADPGLRFGLPEDWEGGGGRSLDSAVQRKTRRGLLAWRACERSKSSADRLQDAWEPEARDVWHVGPDDIVLSGFWAKSSFRQALGQRSQRY